MKYILIIGNWIKTHLVVTLIISAVAVGGVTILLLLNNTPKLDSNNSSSDSSNNRDDNPFSNTLSNGTYGCELMYNGKSFDDDNVIRDWLQKLATYENSINVDSINISEFKKGLFDEFGSNNYIVKDDNIVKLYLTADGKAYEYIIYDISKNQFTLNEELYSNDDGDGWKRVETILNKSIKAVQTKDGFTYSNFGFILIYPSIYNNAKDNGSSDDIVNIDYNKYTGLGDLVCKTPVQNKSDNLNNNDVNQQYLGKYVGTGSEHASTSYVELLANGVAQINVNYCSGWTTYNGTYKIVDMEYDSGKILYITSLSLQDGIDLDISEVLSFRLMDNKLKTIVGYMGDGQFDCGTYSSDLVKN